MPVDYYQTLQIDHQANREQISAAFAKLSIESHPLRNPKSERTARLTQFNAICEAYEVLGNERLKKIYDTKGYYSLSNGFTDGGEEFIGYAFSGNAFVIFKNFFGSENPWSQ